MRRRLAFIAVFLLICIAGSVSIIGVSCRQAGATTVNISTSIDSFLGDNLTEDTIVQAAEADTDEAVGVWGSAQLNLANFRYDCADDNCDLTQATVETVPAPFLSCASLDDEAPHIQYVFDMETNALEVSTRSFKGSAPHRQWSDRDTDIDVVLARAQQQLDVDTFTLSLTWFGQWAGQIVLDDGTSEHLDLEQ